MTDIWSTGPYHFYVDILSKLLELLENKKFDIVSSTIVLFDDNFSKSVVKPLLSNLGLGAINLIWLNKYAEYIVVGRNFFVTKPHIIGSNNSDVINRVYSLIRQKLSNLDTFSKGDSAKIVYYYRQNRIRKVMNDDELLPLLKQRGIHCTTFDDLSYFDAFKLMSSAKLFIGIHGGGLTNMLFMPQGSCVIEIKTNNPNPQNHCYWHLARSLNFDYTMFVAETRGASNVIEGRGCDVFVDSSQLIELIDNYGF
jgi:capsular polysaccharide biosynthesis protein